ncbi:hypothetical protein [Hamadaea tsunoensis]|uniref:hypothetical protein n=1 Tax=Hamadaea tsunoensis TaxID=53368 RepID=UPI0012F7957F|nr:hypothetical protein [Hamadaea tsunoensis]
MASAKKKSLIAAGVIAAGSAAAITAYAVRRRRDRAVDAELSHIIDEAEGSIGRAAGPDKIRDSQAVADKVAANIRGAGREDAQRRDSEQRDSEQRGGERRDNDKKASPSLVSAKPGPGKGQAF